MIAAIVPGLLHAQTSNQPTGLSRSVTTEPLLPARQIERTPAQRLRDILPQISLNNVPARNALELWSRMTGVALQINWDDLAAYGLNPDQPVQLELRDVPAGQVLRLIMDSIRPEHVRLIYEITPWYVEILSKDAADRRVVRRVYDVADLLLEPPDYYSTAPTVDLGAGLQGREGGGNPFRSETSRSEQLRTDQERGEELAWMIRQTIEPEIWKENGGRYASITYFRGKLIVVAPRYVHEQIGRASWAEDQDAWTAPLPDRGSEAFPSAPRSAPQPSSVPRGQRVSGVERLRSAPVSGVQR